MQSLLPGQTTAAFLHCSPLGKRDYWSKFSYNFIFYVDEMHLEGRGRGSGWRRDEEEGTRGGGRSTESASPALTESGLSRRLGHKKKSIVAVEPDC